MDYEQAKTYLLSKPEAFEDYPFGPDVMVPKIKGKMFATLAKAVAPLIGKNRLRNRAKSWMTRGRMRQ